MRAEWTARLTLLGLAVGCGGTLAPTGVGDHVNDPEAAAPLGDAAMLPSGDGWASDDTSAPDASVPGDASEPSESESEAGDGDDSDSTGGEDSSTTTPLCPINMAYIDEAWPQIQSGNWLSCPDGGPCPAGDCCLQYTGWSPPTPMNTTACVPLLDGGM
jgi:hypothetical protein